jgi:hypothetical protein
MMIQERPTLQVTKQNGDTTQCTERDEGNADEGSTRNDLTEKAIFRILQDMSVTMERIEQRIQNFYQIIERFEAALDQYGDTLYQSGRCASASN